MQVSAISRVRINRFHCSSNHWIHGYAVLDRLDFSSYPDTFPSSPIDVKRILINDQDVAQLEDDSIVLMSR